MKQFFFLIALFIFSGQAIAEIIAKSVLNTSYPGELGPVHYSRLIPQAPDVVELTSRDIFCSLDLTEIKNTDGPEAEVVISIVKGNTTLKKRLLISYPYGSVTLALGKVDCTLILEDSFWTNDL